MITLNPLRRHGTVHCDYLGVVLPKLTAFEQSY